MDYYEIVKKLVGPIKPVGETHTDDKRYINLEKTIGLISELLADIKDLEYYAKRQEWSMKKAGKRAEKFFNEIKCEFLDE